jgi:hypothetical protein
MALTLFWRCEGTTLDGTDDFTAADTTAAANNTPAISATGARIGTNGLVFDSASDRYDFTATSIITPSVGSVAGWFQFPTAFPGTLAAIVFNSRGSNSNDYIQIQTLGAVRLRMDIRNSANGGLFLSMSTATLTAGNWYFYAASWNSSTNHRSLSVYDTSGSLLEAVTDNSTAFSTNVPIDLTSIRYGDSTGTTGTMYLDNVFIGSSDSDASTFVSNRAITSYTAYSGGVTSTINPTTGSIVLAGRAATINAFSNVLIRELMINAAGSPVTNRTGMHLLIWYAGSPAGAPDLSYSALTTDAAGTASWNIAAGSLLFGQPIFYLANDGGSSLSAYTCARMVPTYQ